MKTLPQKIIKFPLKNFPKIATDLLTFDQIHQIIVEEPNNCRGNLHTTPFY